MRSGFYQHFTLRVLSFPERNAYREAVYDIIKYVYASTRMRASLIR